MNLIKKIEKKQIEKIDCGQENPQLQGWRYFESLCQNQRRGKNSVLRYSRALLLLVMAMHHSQFVRNPMA